LIRCPGVSSKRRGFLISKEQKQFKKLIIIKGRQIDALNDSVQFRF
jgi:hypothetical protein